MHHHQETAPFIFPTNDSKRKRGVTPAPTTAAGNSYNDDLTTKTTGFFYEDHAAASTTTTSDSDDADHTQHGKNKNVLRRLNAFHERYDQNITGIATPSIEEQAAGAAEAGGVRGLATGHDGGWQGGLQPPPTQSPRSTASKEFTTLSLADGLRVLHTLPADNANRTVSGMKFRLSGGVPASPGIESLACYQLHDGKGNSRILVGKPISGTKVAHSVEIVPDRPSDDDDRKAFICGRCKDCLSLHSSS